MGFMDNIMKKVGAFLATRYGVISSGKYAGCDIALGNPPKEKVTTAYSFSQVVFLKGNEETARFNIATDIVDVEYTETIKFPASGNDGYRCKITFNDGDTCEIDLHSSPRSQIRIFYNNLSTSMLKETREFFEKILKSV